MESDRMGGIRAQGWGRRCKYVVLVVCVVCCFMYVLTNETPRNTTAQPQSMPSFCRTNGELYCYAKQVSFFRRRWARTHFLKRFRCKNVAPERGLLDPFHDTRGGGSNFRLKRFLNDGLVLLNPKSSEKRQFFSHESIVV